MSITSRKSTIPTATKPGDRVLAAVAGEPYQLRHLRGFDDAYRTGGEEFLLCLKEADQKIGLMIVERLRLGLEQNPVGLFLTEEKYRLPRLSALSPVPKTLRPKICPLSPIRRFIAPSTKAATVSW